MNQSLFQHFGEQGDEHRGHLYWSGALNGLPFRGSAAPSLTQEEMETAVEVHWDFYAEEFDLSDTRQHERYTWVMQRAVAGWFYIHHIHRHWDRKTKKRIHYVEWSQRYGELSPVAKAARSFGYATQLNPNSSGPRQTGQPLAGFQGPGY